MGEWVDIHQITAKYLLPWQHGDGMNRRGEFNTSCVQEKMDHQDNKHRYARLDQTFGLEWNASVACWQLFECTTPEAESMQENRSISTNNPTSWIWHKNPSHVRPWCFPEVSAPPTREPQETSSIDLLPSDLFITNKIQITPKKNQQEFTPKGRKSHLTGY